MFCVKSKAIILNKFQIWGWYLKKLAFSKILFGRTKRFPSMKFASHSFPADFLTVSRTSVTIFAGPFNKPLQSFVLYQLSKKNSKKQDIHFSVKNDKIDNHFKQKYATSGHVTYSSSWSSGYQNWYLHTLRSVCSVYCKNSSIAVCIYAVLVFSRAGDAGRCSLQCVFSLRWMWYSLLCFCNE